MSEQRLISRRRRPRWARDLQLTSEPPVVVVRAPALPGVFNYSINEWVKVVAAHPSCNQHHLLVALETAGQRYRIDRRNLHSQSPRALRRALIRLRQPLIHDTLQAWTIATGDTALRFSRVRQMPDGPLIRFLTAALEPIMGADMVGSETLVKAILSARN
jgi:hypothetical protein